MTMLGQTLRHYRITEELGAGGMGVVYKAHDLHLDRSVALKVLPAGASAGSDAERRQRFAREARAASALNHPGIVTIYDIDAAEGVEFIAMEFVPGTTLAALLGGPPLPITQALDYAVQIARALGAAHAAGIVHRDLKPANLMVSDGGHVKVLDFGLAKLSDPLTSDGDAATLPAHGLTATGIIVGTPAYMSPEQAEGQRVDARSDVFSFGSVLYELVTGRRAFEGASPVSTLSAILTSTPPRASAIREGVPPEIDRILRRCLEKDPARRYASALELADELTACQASLTDARMRLRALLRRPRVAVPAGMVLLSLVAGGASLGMHAARARQARNTLIPEIARLAEKRDFWPAFLLARKAEAILGDDALLVGPAREATSRVVWNSKPAGADVYARPIRGADADWVHLGRAIGRPLPTPRGYSAFKIAHAEGETKILAMVFLEPEDEAAIALAARGTGPPPGMVRIRSSPNLLLNYAGYDRRLSVPTGAFWMDVHEVTNREFKQFVDAAGYGRRGLWKHPFVKDGKTIHWEEAAAQFLDSTGRPGPAGWELSTYAEGLADYPVTGVSWYEAAAYAEFVGKRLPTVYHWDAAADMDHTGFFLPGSNFSGRLAPVGTYRGGMNQPGLYDMAGNAREWCFNATGELRFTLGGSADGAAHYFSTLSPRSPFDRSPSNGFRCMKPVTEPVSEELERPLALLPPSQLRPPAPFADAVWKTWLSFLAYPKTPLDAHTDLADDSSPDWRMEKVSFTAAYGGERMQAYLFLPKRARKPYQAVVFWPGGGAEMVASSESGKGLLYRSTFDFVVRDGRAVIYPVLKGTYERGGGKVGPADYFANLDDKFATNSDMHVMDAKDVSRSIDYLESRDDITKERIAFMGYSWGAMMGALPCASEKRIKTGILLSGAMAFPLVAGWAARVTIPMLMINGRFDYLGFERTQLPLFRAFATPAQHKRQLVYETDHGLSGFEKEVVAGSLGWLDTYLGPVAR